MTDGETRTDIHIHFCAAGRFGEFLEFCRGSGTARAGLVSLPDTARGNFNDEVIYAVRQAPERFRGFGCLDYRGSRSETEGAAQTGRLGSEGFSGLKIWLGKPGIEELFNVKLETPIVSGALKAAGDRGMPVLIHLADPPDRCPGFGSFIERGLELFSRFSTTTFIAAHLLFLAGGLPKLGRILDGHPNLFIDTAPGRWFYRPLSENRAEAADFFSRRADRILFGSDAMFFDSSFRAFPPMSISDNLGSAGRIGKFLSAGTDSRIDDPYPPTGIESSGGPEELPCLGLDAAVLDKIFNSNADIFFG